MHHEFLMAEPSQGDPYDLDRFLVAEAPVFATALAELRAGCKRTHWMWFVFPQLAGLGRSPTARFYGMSGLDEARAYLAHPQLAPMLDAVTQAATDAPNHSLVSLFGAPDDLKFLSSMTLFDMAAGREDSPFRRALLRWAGGERDPRTLALLR